MKHPKGILDTSAVLRLAEATERELPDEPVITTVTLAELTVGPLVAEDATTRAARQAHLQNTESGYGDPLPFDVAAARAFGQVATDLRTSGRKAKARAFDALIAAIAISVGLPVYTFDAHDFDGISSLELVVLTGSDEA